MKKHSMRYTLAGRFTFLAAGLLTISLSFLSAVTISRYNEMTDRKVEQLTDNVIALINRNIDYVLEDVVDTSSLLLTSRAVQNTLVSARQASNSYEMNVNLNDMQDLLNNLVYNKKHISMVYVGNESLDMVSRQPTYFYAKMSPVDYNAPPQWVLEARARDGMGSWLRGEKLIDFQGSLLVYTRQIKNLMLLNEIGMMAIGVDSGTLDDIFSQLESSNPVSVVIQERGEPIYSYQSRKSSLLDKLDDRQISALLGEEGFITAPTGDSCYVRNSFNEAANWRVTCIVGFEGFQTEKRNTVMMVMSLALVTAFIMAVVSYGITRRSITGALSELRSFAVGFRSGATPPLTDGSRDDEVAVISKEFQRVVRENEELMINLYKSLYKEKEAELIALQAQINPHFLYNTLDSIFWVAQEYGADDIGRMAVALSRVFRLSLNRGQAICTLRSELELVDNYLAIQNMRYGDKFQVHIDVPEELMEMRVIKLILQPIIENAIFHGVERKKELGRIDVRVCEHGDEVTIVVKDNGLGFEVDPENPLGKGYALKNVDERIRLYYGEEYGLKIESQVGAGTTVTIRIGNEVRTLTGGEAGV